MRESKRSYSPYFLLRQNFSSGGCASSITGIIVFLANGVELVTSIALSYGLALLSVLPKKHQLQVVLHHQAFSSPLRARQMCAFILQTTKRALDLGLERRGPERVRWRRRCRRGRRKLNWIAATMRRRLCLRGKKAWHALTRRQACGAIRQCARRVIPNSLL